MSEENQLTEDAGVMPIKPSAVRRSGKIAYARKVRQHRRNLNPPKIKRVTENNEQQQQKQESPSKDELPAAKTLPEPVKNQGNAPVEASSVAEKEEVNVEDEAGREVSEEKKIDTPDSPQVILDDKVVGSDSLAASKTKNDHDPTIDEQEVKSAFMSTFDEIQEDSREEKNEEESNTPPALTEETAQQVAKTPVVPSHSSSPKDRKARVYHRPHTNETVVVNSNNNDNDSKSTASESREEKDDLSQTSIGNAKRRNRIARHKRNTRKSSSRSNSRNPNTMGYVVSQAFDNMLGYAGGQQHEADDGYSINTEESGSVLADWQEALLTTFGCAAAPRHGMTRKTNYTDDSTVETNNTGQHSIQSNHSSVRHVRSGSNLSGSALSTVSDSNVESVLSFDTTEELADFSKDQKKRTQSIGSYKVPDAYDPNPPKILPQRSIDEAGSLPSHPKKPMYSEDLYSTDFEPVDLLSEGDSMLDSVGKDLLNVANTKANEVLSSIQSLLSTKPSSDDTENGTSTVTSAEEQPKVMNTLSNVTEPLGVITENEGEGSPAGGKNTDLDNKNESNTFENRFEVNVFETVEAVKGTEPENSENAPVGDTAPVVDHVIDNAESASLFEGIDNQEDQPEDLLPRRDEEVETNQETQDESSPVIDEDVPESTPCETEDPSSPSIEKQATETTMTPENSSEKTAMDSVTVDRDQLSPSALPEKQNEDGVTPAVSSSTDVPVKVVSEASQSMSPKSSPAKAKKETKTSFQAALIPPETKKPKKKGLIRRLFKKGKKNKKSKPLASQDVVESSTSQPGTGDTQDTNPADTLEIHDETAADSPTQDSRIESGDKPCPTTPVRDLEGVVDTPKMSNLGLEDRKLTRPVSGTNLADLPGIDEKRSFREDPPTSPVRKTNDDGFEGVSSHAEASKTSATTSTVEESKDISFDSFNLDLDLSLEHSWATFGDDVGAAAFREKAIEDANRMSPQKVSAFPVSQ